MSKRRAITGVVLAALALAASAVAFAQDYSCYLPLRISGAGTAAVNGIAYFAGFADGKPAYAGTSILVEWDSAGRQWEIFDTSGGSPVSAYVNSDNEPTPPRRGWTATGGTSPGPTVSGGEPCPVVVPTGDAGEGMFLDRGLDLSEGEEAPIAGELPLSAIYTVGETVTGSCRILDADGERPVISYVHVYIYSVNIAARPNYRHLVDHWMAPHDWDTREYIIEWDTTDQTAGYYDVRFFFESQTSTSLRIEIVAPE
jgi:hypothetical protein